MPGIGCDVDPASVAAAHLEPAEFVLGEHGQQAVVGVLGDAPVVGAPPVGRSADSGRCGTARSGRRSGSRRTIRREGRAPRAMPRITASATRCISSSQRSDESVRGPAGCGGEEVGAVQSGAGADPGVVGIGAPRRSRCPPCGRGAPTSARRRPGTIRATPARRGSWRSRPSRRRRARRTRAPQRSRSSCSVGSTPCPTMPKKPISRHARSISVATDVDRRCGRRPGRARVRCR